MKLDRIPNDELIIGGIYSIHARNFSVGVYDGQGMIGVREKFGAVYLFTEYMKEMPGEEFRPFGTAFAYKQLTDFVLPEEMVNENNPCLLPLLDACQSLTAEKRCIISVIRRAGFGLVENNTEDEDLKRREPYMLTKKVIS